MGEFNEGIAIIGLNGRFPGADNVELFWENIVKGVESITPLDDQGLVEAGVASETFQQSNYVKVKPMLKKVEWFDAAFFGYSPGEASQIDPQQRLFLECAWGALEDAGCDPRRYDGRISVYASAYLSTYMMGNLRLEPGKLAGPDGLQLIIASDKDYIATRTAYKLHCRGAAVTVQTACSSSLVAVHLACQNLLSCQADLAIAGGVALSFPHYAGYECHPGSMTSPDGHCRPFSAQANGTVFGEAVGAVVLKRLEDAKRERDFIYAVIRGSAVNNDGSSKAGYTAPGVSGQSQAIRMALAAAGVPAETIGYIETHGTGTALGDPLEIRALKEAFGGGNKKAYCALGSVKANIGHTNTAAGIAGLIKTALAVRHRYIPPQLYSETINPLIELDSSPFYIPSHGLEWENDRPRRAGVSSFGVGGTNAHVILEEGPAVPEDKAEASLEIVTLSAKSENALRQMGHNLVVHLSNHPEVSLRDLAHTFRAGRSEFPVRQVLVAQNCDELKNKLMKDPGMIRAAAAGDRCRRIWLFPGQASQYPQMSKGLYDAYEPFRTAMDQCVGYLENFSGLDIRTLIYPETEGMDSGGERLKRTELSQPAIFAVEYALAQLFLSLGITPEGMIGHSLGEYVAACIGGVFSLKDALWVVARRARLMSRASRGNMLAVCLPEADLQSRLTEPLEIAAVNGPALCTVAGPESELAELARTLQRERIGFKKLGTSIAFHSRMMEPFMEEMAQIVATVKRNAPKLPYISGLTGDWITPQQAVDPDYYAHQMRQPVQMLKGLKTIETAISNPVWLELGPGSALSAMVKQAVGPAAKIVPTLPNEKKGLSDEEVFLSALGALWSWGNSMAWNRLFDFRNACKIPLPGYPFEQIRCWIEPGLKEEISGKLQPGPGLLWLPSWRKRSLGRASFPKGSQGICLLFEDGLKLGEKIYPWLADSFQRVIRVRQGTEYKQLETDLMTIPRASEADLHRLWRQLRQQLGRQPDTVIFLWLYNNLREDRVKDQAQVMEEGLYTLLALGKTMAAIGDASPLKLYVIGDRLVSISGENAVFPEKYCITGFCSSLDHEIPGLTTKVIDLPGGRVPETLLKWLTAEFQTTDRQKLIAIRPTGRWQRSMEAFEGGKISGLMRQGGVYLITGGLGGIGVELAARLGEEYRAKLILVGRKPFPQRNQWERYPDTEDARPDQVRIIHILLRLEKLGAKVRVVTGDVSKAKDVEGIFAQSTTLFGSIDGIFHCAGTPGEGPVLYKFRDRVEEVLAPKIQGTKLLASAGERYHAQFLMLFSSTLSLSGGAGQTDYATANAFLNGFAAAWQNRSPLKVIAVNWDAWQGRGMAARAGLTPGQPCLAQPLDAPDGDRLDTLIDDEERDSGGSWHFTKTFYFSKEWILMEHGWRGWGMIPGAAWITMIYQAAKRIDGRIPWRISALQLLAPCRINRNQPLTVRLECKPEVWGYGVRVFSLEPMDSAPYLTGQLQRVTGNMDFVLDLAEIKPFLQGTERDPLFEAVNGSGLLQWGPRWNNVRRFFKGNHTIAAFLSLDEKFLSDRDDYDHHPALLDSALAIAALWDDSATMLPTAYRAIQLNGRLPGAFYSVARIDGESEKGAQVSADISLLNEDGSVLGKIEGFKLQYVTMDRIKPKKPGREGGIPLETGLDLAMSLTGLEQTAEMVVTPGPIGNLLEGETNPSSLTAVREGETAAPEFKAQRPVMQHLQEIWSEVLGITQVKPGDNFFDLGGHSLMAIQVLSRIRAAFAVELEAEAFFKTPTLKGLTQRIEALLPISPDGAIQRDNPARGIRRAEGKRNRFPLSSSQRRLFFYHELERANTAYTLPSALEIDGTPDKEALRYSLSHMVRRHDVLRTTFHQEEADLYQQIHQPFPFSLITEDLTMYGERKAMALAYQKAVELCTVPFDLGCLPLMRATLFSVTERKHVLVIAIHHIISDYWSAGVFLKELAQIYNALIRGDEPRLPELPIQYGDYALWQHRDYFNSRGYHSDMDYWRDHLAGVPELLQLPLDFPRPAEESHQGNTIQGVFDPALIAGVQSVAGREEATLFMALTAAFEVLLYRYSGQKDIVIGSPVSGRRFRETEDLLGMFVNNIVIRGNLEGAPSFLGFLRQLRRTIIDAFNHQDLPFEKMVEAAGVPRDLSYSPLFQVVFILQNAPSPRSVLDGLRLESGFISQTTSKHDLTLECYPTQTGVVCRLEYNSSLFRRDTMERFLKNYTVLLEQIVKEPTEPIDRLQIVHPEEVNTILTGFNRSGTTLGSDRLIHRVISETARQFPDRTACEFAGRQMTYAELDSYSNRLAHFLNGLGVGPDIPVAVCMGRSLKLPAVFQGILKSGGAYIPLDPSLPTARIESILEDAATPWILMDSAIAGDFPGLAARIIRMDCGETGKKLRAQPETVVDSGVRSSNLAYIIYTSGSTGTPKGVAVEHGNLLNLVHALGRNPGIAAEDVLLALTTISFDMSIPEFHLPLIVGAKMVMASRAAAADGELLAKLIREKAVTVMQGTPATWRLLLAAGWQGSSRLKILCGGEALTPDLARELFPRCGSLWNLYGPTETTVWSSVARIDHPEEITIGKPIDNTFMTVLDDRLRMVPIGVPGTLYIGGAGVARGYLNRQALTQEKFVTVRLTDRVSRRFYNSGDLARFLPDGRLEYLGRNDSQVKIRGYRIELGEIEARLGALKGVCQCAVVTAKDAMGSDQLIAYYTLEQDRMMTVPAIRDLLHLFLPDYMIPAIFHRLERLPLTANGKVDRKALAEIEVRTDGESQDPEQPLSDLERLIAKVWREFTGHPAGRNDHFFECGGHSLLAMQVLSRLRQELELAIPLKMLYAKPVLHELAAALQTWRATVKPVETAAVQEAPAAGSVQPLTMMQRWFFQELPGRKQPARWNTGLLLKMTYPLEYPRLATAVLEVVNHHPALRALFAPGENDQWVQRMMPPAGQSPADFIDLSKWSVGEQSGMIQHSCDCRQNHFNLETGPLFQVILFKLDGKDFRFWINAHHVLLDGVSLMIILEDIMTVYDQLISDRPVLLASAGTPPGIWTEELVEMVREQTMNERDYWLSLPWEKIQWLPADYPETRDRVTVASIRSFESTLDPMLTHALTHDIPKQTGIELSDILIAALLQAVTGWTGEAYQDMMVLDNGRNLLAAREDLDVSRTVGWLSSERVLVLKRAESSRSAEALREIGEQIRAIPGKGHGYNLLRYLGTDRELSARLGLLRKRPGILFNFLGNVDLFENHQLGMSFADETTGFDEPGDNLRFNLLEFHVYHIHNALRLGWRYSCNVHSPETVKKLDEEVKLFLNCLAADEK